MSEINFGTNPRVLPSRTKFTFSTSGVTKEEAIEKLSIAIEKLSNGDIQLDPLVHLESYVSGVNISCSPA